MFTLIDKFKNILGFDQKLLGMGLTYDDVLLVPGHNVNGSRQNVKISSTDKSGKFSLSLPIISANMDMITGSEMADFMSSQGGIGALHRLMSIKANVEEFKKVSGTCFVSIGCNEKGLKRAEGLYEAGAKFFNLDIAHGDSSDMGPTLVELKKRYSDIFIMAGNVATFSGASYLYDYGADIVKVGIGGGSVCTTRVKTGFGVSNITAIKECSKLKCSIVADGGIRSPADVVKALAFGADFVMVGSLLAGTRPTPGNVVELNGNKSKIYRGLDSQETQMSWFGEVPRWRTPEGISAHVEYREDEDQIIHDLVGGIRSGLTYCGVDNIKDLQKNFRYRIVTSSSVLEGMPHRMK